MKRVKLPHGGAITRAFSEPDGFKQELLFISGLWLERSSELTLSEPQELVVIDEIQRLSWLFATLRPPADRSDHPARFVILGSASPELVKRASESLAGRVSFVDLRGLGLEEVGSDGLPVLCQHGGFPRSFLAASDSADERLILIAQKSPT
jgi:predicted AAA+ superfamily ATPase